MATRKKRPVGIGGNLFFIRVRGGRKGGSRDVRSGCPARKPNIYRRGRRDPFSRWREVSLRREMIQRKMVSGPVAVGNRGGDEVFCDLDRLRQIVPQRQRSANRRRISAT